MKNAANVEKKMQDLPRGAVVKSSTLSEDELKMAQQKVNKWSQDGYSTMAIMFYLSQDYADYAIGFYIEHNMPIFNIN